MGIGCLLVVCASRSLRPLAMAFRYMVSKRDLEASSPEQLHRSCCAISAALTGWILGGLLCVGAGVIQLLYDFPAEVTPRLLSAIPLNGLLYTVLALFVLLPIRLFLRQRLV